MLTIRSAGRDFGFITSSKMCSGFEDVKFLPVESQVKRFSSVRRMLVTDLENLEFLGLANPHLIDSLERILCEMNKLLQRYDV